MIDAIILIAVLISGAATAAVIHEGTHFAVGLVMGTVREVGIIFPRRDGWKRHCPQALYVNHSRRNWAATLAPLVWTVPFFAVYQVIAEVPPFVALHLLVVFGIAGFGTLISDIPAAFGLIDFSDERDYRRVVLVDYT